LARKDFVRNYLVVYGPRTKTYVCEKVAPTTAEENAGVEVLANDDATMLLLLLFMVAGAKALTVDAAATAAIAAVKKRMID